MSIETMNFIGLDTEYRTADGKRLVRLHMDGAASPLPATEALNAIQALLPHYSNTHSYVHNSAHISTHALNWAHTQMLEFLNAKAHDYTAIFMGAGTTAAVNRLARGLHQARPERNIVLVSAMEHHANDLPHRQFGNEVHYIPLTGHDASQGAIDLEQLETLLQTHQGKVNYVAFSYISNVTGIINPVSEITRLAHRYGAQVVVDAAQAVAHKEITLSDPDPSNEIDFLLFSGHKVYCPTAPGVLIAKKASLSGLKGQDLGGGSVADVSYYDFQLLTEYPQKEQSGTPNIVGAIALARVLKALSQIGIRKIEQHNQQLMGELIEALSSLSNIEIYGDENVARLGALSFNHRYIDHGLLAAILNDYYVIAVRNECFCAHPYVSSLLKETLWQIDLSNVAIDEQQSYINRKRGMVRASISLYNTSDDIERLIQALIEIDERIEELAPNYKALADGTYQHRQFAVDWMQELGWS